VSIHVLPTRTHMSRVRRAQVLSAVDPGSVSSIAACARTLDCLGALQLRLLHNQEDWHGGDQPQTKLYSINQVGGRACA